MNNSPENKKSNARYYIPAAVAAGALGARLAWRRIMNRGLPPEYAQIAVPALDRSVEILRDNWAVPHIYASSRQDLFFAQGFVHAQDDHA